MASTVVELSVYLKPALCANQHSVEGKTTLCTNDAANACGGCQLVQYCSKECQKAHWPVHKATCKSDLLKASWTPGWYLNNRIPAFIGDGPPLVQFGRKKYLWGNMPALDILQLQKNEGAADIKRDFALLFAASGDIRNVVKTVASLPAGHEGKCNVVVNDMDFDIVARNAIILLIALHYEAEVAVPMIIHIWYSVLLPSAMVQSLQADIRPLIEGVCSKIADKASDSVQAKTFDIGGRSLRLVLKKDEWTRLVTYFQVPQGLTAANAQTVRRDVTLASSRVDYRERAMLQWPPSLRQGEQYFRESGILLPYGCSVVSFDTPNPTFFQTYDWPMMDNASPRDGWGHGDYSKHSLPAKADTFGAVFLMLRGLLLKFCKRVKKVNISFELLCVNAMDISSYIGPKRFDRIEISNICDRGYIGPQASFEVFSPLLKDKNSSPKATLLMLFLNVAKETEYKSTDASNRNRMELALKRTQKYLPPDYSRTMSSSYGHPDSIRRVSCLDLLTDFSGVFDDFIKSEFVAEVASMNGLKIKSKHTIIEPWPYKVGLRATQKEFDILVAGSTAGFERYMEVEKI